MNKLRKLAHDKWRADVEYNAAFDTFWTELQVLSDKQFFEFAKLYLKEVIDFRFTLAKSDGIKQAAWEVFRRALCGDKGYNGKLMVRFAKTYHVMRERLYKPLFDVIKNKGDDGYGDLLDNLVMLGEPLFTDLESKKYGNDSAVREAVSWAIKDAGIDSDKVMDFIWNGENYHGLSLFEAARKYVFLTLSREEGRPDE